MRLEKQIFASVLNKKLFKWKLKAGLAKLGEKQHSRNLKINKQFLFVSPSVEQWASLFEAQRNKIINKRAAEGG